LGNVERFEEIFAKALYFYNFDFLEEDSLVLDVRRGVRGKGS